MWASGFLSKFVINTKILLLRDQQSETLQKYTLVSIVFTDDLGQVSHPFVRCKITLNENSKIENSFLWEAEKTIFREFKVRRLQTTNYGWTSVVLWL